MVAAIAAATALLGMAPPPQASAAYAHTVVAGETLSGIAYANGISTESLAAYNGIAADTLVLIGQTLQIPSAGTTTSTVSSGEPAAAPASWTTQIYSPMGTAYLA